MEIPSDFLRQIVVLVPDDPFHFARDLVHLLDEHLVRWKIKNKNNKKWANIERALNRQWAITMNLRCSLP